MSKIKEELMRIQQEELEQYVSFMEWVCDQKTDTGVRDMNEDEEDSQEPSSIGTSILPAITLKPINNIDYNPTRSIR